MRGPAPMPSVVRGAAALGTEVLFFPDQVQDHDEAGPVVVPGMLLEARRVADEARFQWERARRGNRFDNRRHGTFAKPRVSRFAARAIGRGGTSARGSGRLLGSRLRTRRASERAPIQVYTDP